MIGRALAKTRDGLISLAYPQQCRICDSDIESWDDGVTCARCWNDPAITKLFHNQQVCAKCGAPMLRGVKPIPPAGMEQSSENIATVGLLCGTCATLPFAFARSCGVYAGALEANVLFLKSQPYLCRRLRLSLAKTFSDNRDLLAGDMVVPMPLHRKRKRERGFNQADVIAKAISSDFNLPLDNLSLTRSKYTERHRAGMDRIDRARSVERAFEVARPKLIAGKTILLVDDIYTTGSTISASVRTLLETGAERVNVLTIARVVSPLH